MIYKLCKDKIIKGCETESEKKSMKNKLDVFLLTDALTAEEYEELCKLLYPQVNVM